MRSRAFVNALLGVALIGGCDISQKTPETVQPPPADLAGALIRGGTVPVGGAPEAPQMGAAETPVIAGEKSIRLQGRGVSRARQTRV